MALIFVGIAGLVHAYIFLLETRLWARPRTNRIFGLSPEQAEQNRLFAFNQGYYNLFLSVAAFGGIGCFRGGFPTVGMTLMGYAALSMVGAAGVLLYSQPRLVRPACIQGLPPLLGLIGLYLARSV